VSIKLPKAYVIKKKEKERTKVKGKQRGIKNKKQIQKGKTASALKGS
jgi:hypothetical protein